MPTPGSFVKVKNKYFFGWRGVVEATDANSVLINFSGNNLTLIYQTLIRWVSLEDVEII